MFRYVIEKVKRPINKIILKNKYSNSKLGSVKIRGDVELNKNVIASGVELRNCKLEN